MNALPAVSSPASKTNNVTYLPNVSTSDKKSSTKSTKTTTKTSAVSVTPRKMEAIAVLIRAITGLVSEIRKAFVGPAKSSVTAEEPVQSQPKSSSSTTSSGTTASKQSATPISTTTTPSIATPAALAATPEVTSASAQPASQSMGTLSMLLEQIFQKLSEIQTALASLLGIGSSSSATSIGTSSLPNMPTQAVVEQQEEKGSWLDTLGNIANIALDFVPGMGIIKKGAGFVTKAIKSFF